MAKKRVYECPSCGAKVKGSSDAAAKLPRCPNCADVMREKKA